MPKGIFTRNEQAKEHMRQAALKRWKRDGPKKHPFWKGGVWDNLTPVGKKKYISDWGKNHRIEIREKLFNVLGQYSCVRCGFSDKRALQFDHVNGGGDQDCYKITGKYRQRNLKYYKFYLSHPEEAKKNLQVLCANCNWIKRTENNESKTCGVRREMLRFKSEA